MAEDDYRNGRHVVYKLHAHLIFVTKYRKKVMTDRVTDELRSAFEEVCGRHDVTLDAFETDHDHAHLLVSYPPKLALSTLVMSLKTISSIWVQAQPWPEVRNALSGDHFWSPSYCAVSCGGAPLAVSCGGAPLDVIKAYLEDQRAPNRPKGRPKSKA